MSTMDTEPRKMASRYRSSSEIIVAGASGSGAAFTAISAKPVNSYSRLFERAPWIWSNPMSLDFLRERTVMDDGGML